MPFFGFLILAAILWIRIAADERRAKNKADKYMTELKADGWGRKANPELEEKYVRELTELWRKSVLENKPELFFPEKREFFYSCPGALETWIQSEAEERVIQDGYAPKIREGNFSIKMDSQHWRWRMSKYSTLESQFNKNKTRIDPWEGIPRV